MAKNHEEHWTEAVYDIVRQIPRGKVTTYGFIGKIVGTSPRVVGWAMNQSHNQAKKVPAHRVVNRKGLLTGSMHFETPTRMQELLEKEGVKIKENQIVNFEKHLWQPK
jgi:methylated-DNA-protein-cysteine methyltransferase-like protein